MPPLTAPSSPGGPAVYKGHSVPDATWRCCSPVVAAHCNRYSRCDLHAATGTAIRYVLHCSVVAQLLGPLLSTGVNRSAGCMWAWRSPPHWYLGQMFVDTGGSSREHLHGNRMWVGDGRVCCMHVLADFSPRLLERNTTALAPWFLLFGHRCVCMV